MRLGITPNGNLKKALGNVRLDTIISSALADRLSIFEEKERLCFKVELCFYEADGDDLNIVHADSFAPEDIFWEAVNDVLVQSHKKDCTPELVVEVVVKAINQNGLAEATFYRFKKGPVGPLQEGVEN